MLIDNQRVIEIVEAGTSLRQIDRDRARQATGLYGDPLILWVGRLTTNKDPLAVLDGFERVLPELPDARMVMVFGDDTLLGNVVTRVNASELLRNAVALTGRVDHDEMPNYYGACDIYVSGSHSEGSGYALIEAIAAGLVPVVTDIPSFAAIAGDCGKRWTPRHAGELAAALRAVWSHDRAAQHAQSRARYDSALSWPAIGSRTFAEYSALVKVKSAASP